MKPCFHDFPPNDDGGTPLLSFDDPDEDIVTLISVACDDVHFARYVASSLDG